MKKRPNSRAPEQVPDAVTVIRRTAPWEGTPFEPILKSLHIPGESEANHLPFWNFCYGVVLKIAAEAKADKRHDQQTLSRQSRNQRRKARLCKKLALAEAKDDPALAEHLRAKAKVHAEEAQALKSTEQELLLIRGYGSNFPEPSRRQEALAELVEEAKHAHHATHLITWRLLELLSIVKQVTRSPCYQQVAALLKAAGFRATVASLKKTCSRHFATSRHRR